MNNLRGFSGFRAMLAARQKAVNSVVCVGLDPLPEKLPTCIPIKESHSRSGEKSKDIANFIADWMADIVDATAHPSLPCTNRKRRIGRPLKAELKR